MIYFECYKKLDFASAKYQNGFKVLFHEGEIVSELAKQDQLQEIVRFVSTNLPYHRTTYDALKTDQALTMTSFRSEKILN